MKKSICKCWSAGIVVAAMCVTLLVGCGGQKLSSDFNQEEVKKAAENVVALMNDKDKEGLQEICTVRLKEALTDDVLKQVFEAIDEGGKFEDITDMSIGGSKDKSSGEEFAVVVVKAKYEIKTFTYTLSFTKQMKLAGLFYK